MCPSEITTGFRDGAAKILAPANILDDAATLAEYSRDRSFTAHCTPLLAVYPENKEQIQQLVKLANESKMPLIPVSSGPPRFNGDTIPAQGGVIVDFSKMKRIIKIDPLNRYVMMEPGVTYGELIPELTKQGQRICHPLLPRANKSVVASRLEREPVLIPKYQYDYLDPLLTMELIYGTGEDFRTGSASGPGPFETFKADKVNPWGPGSLDFFRFVSAAQGTMGLATWAMTKTEVLPSLQKLYFIPIENIEDLTPPMNMLLRKRVVDECLALNNVTLATILAEGWESDFQALKANLPPWTIIVCIAGYLRRPEERVNIQDKYLKDICDELRLKPQIHLRGAEGREKKVMQLLADAWRQEPYWKLRYKGSCRNIFFLSPLSEAVKYPAIMQGVAAKYRYAGSDIGCYIQPMVQGRGCHCEFILPCDESDAKEMSEVQKLFLDASATLMDNGAFFSRPYGAWSEMVYNRDSAGTAALKKLKQIFDPNNIFNPGKLCF